MKHGWQLQSQRSGVEPTNPTTGPKPASSLGFECLALRHRYASAASRALTIGLWSNPELLSTSGCARFMTPIKRTPQSGRRSGTKVQWFACPAGRSVGAGICPTTGSYHGGRLCVGRSGPGALDVSNTVTVLQGSVGYRVTDTAPRSRCWVVCGAPGSRPSSTSRSTSRQGACFRVEAVA
jgi:hypothetical protein